ncbi:MAG: glycosyltransferase [bacterium]|nr:glycosyltransferase [bacterium]
MRIIVVDHPYHAVTRSADFVLGPLAARHDVEVIHHNTYESDLPPMNLLDFDAAFFFQVPPRRPHPNLTWAPMYDSVALSRRGAFHPLGIEGVRHLCCCRRLHEEVSAHGLPARYFQYWPDPLPPVRYDEPALFFWYRSPAIGWEGVKAAIGDFPLARIFIKNNPDPGYEKITIPALDRRRWRIEVCDSFLPGDEYGRVLAAHNINVASRAVEGIGLTTLEMMRRGYCVVALDRPTANEYITHGKTGILMREIGPVGLERYAEIGRAARETVRVKSAEWRQRVEDLVSYIATGGAA